MKPQVVLRTERLVVRRLEREDLEAMVAVYGDPEGMRFVGDGKPLDRDGCREWVEVTLHNYRTRGYGLSAVTWAQSGEIVGFAGLVHPRNQAEPELKYALARAWWGRGLATEVARGMLSWAAMQGLPLVIATVDAEHEVSKRVLAKAGMRWRDTRDDGDTQVETWIWEPRA